MSIEQVEAVIARTLVDAEREMLASGPVAAERQARLATMLARADAELGRRLARWNAATGGDMTAFTAASLVSYREQIGLLQERVAIALGNQTVAAAGPAWRAGIAAVGAELYQLETAFTGIARPVRLSEAMRFDPSNGRASSVLASIETSVDRYTSAMISEFERNLSLGFLAGLSQGEMVQMLTGHGGPRGVVSLRARVVGGQVVRTMTENIPEGLFVRHRSWAWRIVRTEASNAYNVARVERLSELEREIPTLKKKIIAHFDNRTAQDSVAVHGQVRDISGVDRFFVDGAGRVYEQPPARPNDRETVIPWEQAWGEVPSTQQLDPAQVNQVDQDIRAGRPAVDPVGQRAADLAEEARLNAIREAELAAASPGRSSAPRPPRATSTASAPAPTASQAPAGGQAAPPAAPRVNARNAPRVARNAGEWQVAERFGNGMTADDFRELGRILTPATKQELADWRDGFLDGKRQVEIRDAFRDIVANRSRLPAPLVAEQPFANFMGSNRGNALAAHANSGESFLNRKGIAGMGRVGREMGTIRSAGVGEQVSSLIHEELHGFSPVANMTGGFWAMRGYGIMAEEIATETQALRITSRVQADRAAILGTGSGSAVAVAVDAQAVTLIPNAGYADVVAATLDEAVRVAGAAGVRLTRAQALDVVAEASENLWLEMRAGQTEFAREYAAIGRRIEDPAFPDQYRATQYEREDALGTAYARNFVRAIHEEVASRFGAVGAVELDASYDRMMEIMAGGSRDYSSFPVRIGAVPPPRIK